MSIKPKEPTHASHLNTINFGRLGLLAIRHHFVPLQSELCANVYGRYSEGGNLRSLKRFMGFFDIKDYKLEKKLMI